MTHGDLTAAAELIVMPHDPRHIMDMDRTLDRLKNNVGESDKKRKKEIHAALILRVLSNYPNGTFVWKDGPKRGDKHANVFEALAADMPNVKAQEMGLSEKVEHISEIAPQLQSGFYAARKWLEKWSGGTIYRVPQHEEASTQTVLTVDPYFILEGGKTASEMQTIRDVKLAEGQLNSSAARLATALPPHKVRASLDRMLKHALRVLENRDPHFPPITDDSD